MTLSHLSLTNFRSFKEFAHDFGPTVIFVGDNGLGKTNLLEAMYLLAVMKSYRTVSDAEVIRFGEEFAKIVGKVSTDQRPFDSAQGKPATSDQIELVIHKGQKRAKKNGAVKPLSQLIGTLKAVLFSPEQLDIVTGPPRRRRRFLDALLSQIDRHYTQSLMEYQKALQNRNVLLAKIKQGGASATELYFWDKRLIESSVLLTKHRTLFLDYFNKHLPALYQSIAEEKERLTIVPRFQSPTHELFQQHLPRDVQLAATTIGPHRDNFTLRLGNRDLELFGSRGEWRSALFALKSCEVAFLREKTGEDPVLLLDDAFSELDQRRREHLLPHFMHGQTFTTTTDLAALSPALREKGQVIEVKRYARPIG